MKPKKRIKPARLTCSRTYIVQDRALPFDLRPNPEAMSAMLEARTGKRKASANVKELLAELNASNDHDPQ